MGNLLPIGLFSDASLLSVRALRRYHEQGLLVPASVDARSGYRAYAIAQLADAEVIRRLRDLDVPLPEVRRVLDARDPAVTADVLAHHRRRLQARIDEAERIVGEVQELLGNPGELHRVLVHRRIQQPEPVVALRRPLAMADVPDFFAGAFPHLLGVVDRHGARVTGPVGGRFGDGEGMDREGMVVEAFVPTDRPLVVGADGDVVSGHLPATTLAVALHVGPYETMSATYGAVGAWVAENEHCVTGPLQELYLLGPGSDADPAQYRTEVGWPVKPITPVPQEEPCP